MPTGKIMTGWALVAALVLPASSPGLAQDQPAPDKPASAHIVKKK